MRMVPRVAGAVVLALAVGTADSAVRDVDSLPGVAQWVATSGSSHEPQRRNESRVSAMLQQGDDAAALHYVRSLSATQPAQAAGLHETLAGAYLTDRRLFWSTQHLDAIAAARRTDQARYLAAHIAARQRRLSDAAANLDALARRLPDDPLVARDQAQIASLLGRHEVAAAACERRLRLEPADGRAALLLARTRMQQGRADEAERLLATLLVREPRNAPAAMQLGLIQLARREPENARDWFAKARSIEKQDAAPYLGEAAAALLLGQRPAARAAAAGARRLNPADPLAALLELLATDEPLPAVVLGRGAIQCRQPVCRPRDRTAAGGDPRRTGVRGTPSAAWRSPISCSRSGRDRRRSPGSTRVSKRGGQPGVAGPLLELTAVRALGGGRPVAGRRRTPRNARKKPVGPWARRSGAAGGRRSGPSQGSQGGPCRHRPDR